MRKILTRALRKRIEDVHQGLDLGFSDYYDGENVRDLTLVKHLRAIEEAEQMLGLDEAMNFSLWQELGPDHPSPNIYVWDFPSDFRAAFYSLLGGYYRQSILCLRNWLEMRLLGIYFGRVEQNRSAFRAWKRGNSVGPFGNTLIRRLFARAEFRTADAQLGLRRRLEKLYGDLSAFTHGAGLERHQLQQDTDNVPRYNRKSVLKWCRMVRRVFAEVTVCLSVAYGRQVFEALDRNERKAVLVQLGRPYRRMVRVSCQP